jgi:hypothetical protein
MRVFTLLIDFDFCFFVVLFTILCFGHPCSLFLPFCSEVGLGWMRGVAGGGGGIKIKNKKKKEFSPFPSLFSISQASAIIYFATRVSISGFFLTPRPAVPLNRPLWDEGKYWD